MSDPRFFPQFPPGFPGIPQGLRPPSNPVFGQQWLDWWWNGVAWLFGPSPVLPGSPGGPGGALPPDLVVVPLNQIPIYNSTQYVPNPRLVRVLVELKGGAGPGGGVVASTGIALAAGSGGSGAFSRAFFDASNIGSGINITIGPGGIGAPGAAGTNGGTTSFGTLLSAPGGFSGAPQLGGAGAPAMASPPIGALALPGDPGGDGAVYASEVTVTSQPGAGGVYGGGAPGVGNSTTGSVVAGRSGQNGGGGSGAVGIGSTGTAPGGNGGNGWCFLTEYCLVNVRDLMASQSAQSAAAQAQIAAQAQPVPPALAAVSGGSFCTGSGNKQINGGFPQAADDASAAALTPPVPVGGLYVTAAGVVQQRLV